MDLPDSSSEASEPDLPAHLATSVFLKGRHEDDGYELEEPLVLSALSNDQVQFAIVAADPDQGTVTVNRSGTDEYWIFPTDHVSSLARMNFDFVKPERSSASASKKKVAALCAAVSVALLALLAAVHASGELRSAEAQTNNVPAKAQDTAPNVP